MGPWPAPIDICVEIDLLAFSEESKYELNLFASQRSAMGCPRVAIVLYVVLAQCAYTTFYPGSWGKFVATVDSARLLEEHSARVPAVFNSSFPLIPGIHTIGADRVAVGPWALKHGGTMEGCGRVTGGLSGHLVLGQCVSCTLRRVHPDEAGDTK